MKASDVKNRMQQQKAPAPGKSSLKDKFLAQKADLMKRHQEQVDSKDQGSDFPTVFIKEKIPKNMGMWKPGKGEHLIDLIPFFAGCQHPKVDEGKLAYVVDFFVHPSVGTLRTPYPCTTKNFKMPDIMCEYLAKQRVSKAEWKRISSKRRTAYLVWVHDTPEEEKKGIQIWEVAHFYFEQHVDAIAKSPRGGGAVAFSDIASGKSIAFEIKTTGKYQDDDGTERDSIGFVGHKFVDRDIDIIPDKILEQVFPLDEAINMFPDEEEMAEAFSPSGRSRYADPEPEAATEPEPEPEYTEDDIPSNGKKVTKGKKRPEPEPEPEPDPEEGDPEEIIEEGEGDPEEIIEEGSGDPEEITECPHHPDSFGELDDHPECTEDGGCPLWDSCSDEYQRQQKAAELEAKKAAARKPPAKPSPSSASSGLNKKPMASSANRRPVGKR